jgi:hypothetical protein
MLINRTRYGLQYVILRLKKYTFLSLKSTETPAVTITKENFTCGFIPSGVLNNLIMIIFSILHYTVCRSSQEWQKEDFFTAVKRLLVLWDYTNSSVK